MLRMFQDTTAPIEYRGGNQWYRGGGWGGYIRVQYKVFLGITYIKRRVDNNIPSVCEISFRYNMSQCSDMQISRG